MAVLALDSGVDELGCAPGDGGGGGAGAGHGICDQLGDGSGVLKVTIFQQGVGCVCGPCVGRSANKKKEERRKQKAQIFIFGCVMVVPYSLNKNKTSKKKQKEVLLAPFCLFFSFSPQTRN